MQRHVPGKHGVNHVTPCICVDFFGLTAVLGRSIRILCCGSMDDDTNLLHLFRDITKQILIGADGWPSGNIAQLRGYIF